MKVLIVGDDHSRTISAITAQLQAKGLDIQIVTDKEKDMAISPKSFLGIAGVMASMGFRPNHYTDNHVSPVPNIDDNTRNQIVADARTKQAHKRARQIERLQKSINR